MRNLIITNDYEIVSSTLPAREAATRLAREGIHALYICEQNMPIGVVTHIDFVYAITKHISLERALVIDICKRPVIAIQLGTTLAKLREEFERTRFVLLPVVDHYGHLVGAVSKHDMFEELVLPADGYLRESECH